MVYNVRDLTRKEVIYMNKKPVTAIIVGAGHRAMVYSELAKTNPELLRIVGVADPNPVRRKKQWNISASERICALNLPKTLLQRANLQTL